MYPKLIPIFVGTSKQGGRCRVYICRVFIGYPGAGYIVVIALFTSVCSVHDTPVIAYHASPVRYVTHRLQKDVLFVSS